MRNTFIQNLTEQAQVDERIFLITADMGYSVIEGFTQKFPDRYLNVGIAEQNAIGIAAGLALSGRVVYVYSIIPFVTMRGYEQIRVDIAYMNTNVRLVGVGAGLSYGAAGTTHHSIEDIAIMRALPNMVVSCPADSVETREILKQSYVHEGPMYIRLGRNSKEKIHQENLSFEIGESIVVCEGKDITLIATSNMVETGLEVVRKLTLENVSASLISMPTIKPVDQFKVQNIIQKRTPIFTLEEHNVIGGLGSAVAEVISEFGKPVVFKRIGINDEYCHFVGDHEFLRKKMNLNVEHILETIRIYL